MSTPDEWEDAACRSHDPDIWFPDWDDTRTKKQAIEICLGCPFRVECADLGRNEDHGIWGGTTPTERNRGEYARKK